jgi:hypothetical protein
MRKIHHKIIALLILCVYVSGCAITSDNVRKSVNAAERVRQAAMDTLDHVDDQKQHAIRDSVKTPEDVPAAENAFKAWVSERTIIDVAIAALRSAEVVVLATLQGVEDHKMGKKDLDVAMQGLGTALLAVQELIKLLGAAHVG